MEFRFSEEEEFQIAMDRPYNRNIFRRSTGSVQLQAARHQAPPARRRLHFRLIDEVEEFPFEEDDLQAMSSVFLSSDANLFDINFVIPSSSAENSSSSTSLTTGNSYTSNGGQSPIPSECKNPEKSADLFDAICRSPKVYFPSFHKQFPLNILNLKRRSFFYV